MVRTKSRTLFPNLGFPWKGCLDHIGVSKHQSSEFCISHEQIQLGNGLNFHTRLKLLLIRSEFDFVGRGAFSQAMPDLFKLSENVPRPAKKLTA